MPKLAISKKEAPDRLLPSQHALLGWQMVNQAELLLFPLGLLKTEREPGDSQGLSETMDRGLESRTGQA